MGFAGNVGESHMEIQREKIFKERKKNPTTKIMHLNQAAEEE